MTDERDVLQGVGALEAAEQRAFMRGQASTKLESIVESHEKRLGAINGSIDRGARATEELRHTVAELAKAFEMSVAVTTARAEDARKAAEAQVSTRTFILGLVGAVTAIGALLASTGHV